MPTKNPNRYAHLNDGSVLVMLERSDGTVLPCYIDTSVFGLVRGFRWYAQRHRNTFYAATNVRKPDGTQMKLYLHRLLLPDAKEIDHRDGNGLNNRRANLRAATSSQNKANKVKRGNTSSVFKGVSWHKRGKKWQTQIKSNGKNIHLGYFVSELDAARAYNKAALKHFKEFARLNEVPVAQIGRAA